MRSRLAFTLIELLVVIAIISLLVSILLPSLNRAKSLARTVMCVSNVRTINIALTIYVEENTYYPPLQGTTIYPPTGEITTTPWFYLLYEQMPGLAGHSAGVNADSNFLTCPEAPEWLSTWGHDAAYGYNFKSFAAGRGLPNQSVWPGNYTDLAKVTADDVPRPADKFFTGDGAFGHYSPTFNVTHGDWLDSPSVAHPTPLAQQQSTATQRHNGWTVANMGYADGHAATDGRALFDGSKEGNLWNYDNWALGDAWAW